MGEDVIFFITIALALAYAYSNGINDAANAIATVVSTRAMSPMAAVAMGASLNLVGALTGTAVARTIGKGIVDPSIINEYTVMAAIIASVLWVLGATRLGLPVSVSHSLVASLVGAGLATAGMSAINGAGVAKVLIALAASPLLGFAAGYVVMLILYRLVRRATPGSVRSIFWRLQVLSGAFMAYSHGKNDGQNAMGIIALAAFIRFSPDELTIDLWMILVSAAAIGLGTALGGWREAASEIGLPVSTTHTISSSIMGVGATRRLSAVRWGVTKSIAMAWLVTYPVCFVLAWVIASLFEIAFL